MWFNRKLITSSADSNVDDNDMLATLRWWRILNVGGRIIILMTFSMLIIGHQNRRSESCHQRKRSSASVPNIDVTAANSPSHQVVVARKLFIKASGWWQQASDSWMLLASNNYQICQQKKVIVVNIHVVCW